MSKIIDFRSDTVTQPSAGMRERMASADVGDDVYDEDLTTIALERKTAQMAGKEAALFFPSGTMSNLAALLSHCQRGEEFIVGRHYHTFKYEAGGAAVLGGISPYPLEVQSNETLALEDIKNAIKDDDFHFPITRVLSLENTVNGQTLSQEYMFEACNIMRENGLNCHLDGARIFNASINLGKDIEALTSPFDTVSICLSKGLGAPVGSVLVGDQEKILKAKRWRKMLGGGMRQTGILAAAGLHALDNNIERLIEDHENAKSLADGLRQIKNLDVDINYTGTNMVFVTFKNLDQLENIRSALSEENIIIASGSTKLRFVCHLDISFSDIETTLEIIDENV